MIIGKFELIDGSYVGMIDTLNGSIATTIHPQERGPDYLVGREHRRIRGGVEAHQPEVQAASVGQAGLAVSGGHRSTPR